MASTGPSSNPKRYPVKTLHYFNAKVLPWMSSIIKCCAAGFLGSQWLMNSGRLASRGGAAIINKVGMNYGVRSRYTQIFNHYFRCQEKKTFSWHISRSFSKFTLVKIEGRKLVCLVTLHKCWQLAMDSHHIGLDRNMLGVWLNWNLVCCMLISIQKS